MVLVDSSVWIGVFSRQAPIDIETFVDFDDVVTCLPVIQEVLQGFDDEFAFRKARDAMLSLPIVESSLKIEVVNEAVSLYRVARRQGFTIRSSVDCLIAACGLRNNLRVLHRDRDFHLLAKVCALQEQCI